MDGAALFPDISLVEWDGKQITKPGIYLNIPISEYHGNPDLCDGPSISGSGIKVAGSRDKSPYDFWAFSHYNPNAYPAKTKKHFDIGAAVHLLTLKDEPFYDHFVEVPEEVLSKSGSTNTGAYRDWADGIGERRPLKRSELSQIEAMAEAVCRSPAVRVSLEGIIEATIVWRDEETGLWLRSRPDALPASGTYCDLKTIGRDVTYRAMRNALNDMGYYVQLALMAEGMMAVAGQETVDFGLVWVGTEPPYHVVPTAVDPMWIEIGRREMRQGIRAIAHGFETGEWPDRAEMMGGWPSLSVPEWRLKQYEQDQEEEAV